ncbi:MAG: isochorismatase family protein [Candidatus Methanomethylophilaceae archaeon]|nr:isochorismatase family protein [Candidatus Methanomethylophilaceae archaeon]
MRYDPLGKDLALVVIDVQRKYMLREDGTPKWDGSGVDRINELSRMFRDAGRPVVFVRFMGCRDHCAYQGDDGDDLVEGVDVREGDLFVPKGNMNSFLDSDLEAVVRGAGCNGILLAGTVSNMCVLATYFGAFDRGLTSYIAEGACMSGRTEVDRAVELICKKLTLEDVRGYLAGEPMVGPDPW